MMIQISHRGNTNGPNPVLENNPEYLIDAIQKGFDVEVDIWLKDGSMYFGHDEPKYIVSPEIFYKIRDHAWFHCKNLEVLNHLIEFHPTSRFFWHQEDDFTLTSNNYIWTYPNKMISNKSIIVYLDKHLDVNFKVKPFAICSDYCYTFTKES
jgi:hypothetical protein